MGNYKYLLGGFAFAGNKFKATTDGHGYLEEKLWGIGSTVGNNGGSDGTDAVDFD